MKRMILSALVAIGVIGGAAFMHTPAAQADPPPFVVLPLDGPPRQIIVDLPVVIPPTADDLARMPVPGNPNPILDFGLIRGAGSFPQVVHVPGPGSNDMNQGICTVVPWC